MNDKHAFLIMAHNNKEQLLELLCFANAGASLITTRKGALKVMPNRQEIQDLMKSEIISEA